MDHVAIDLGARKSQICCRSSEGKILSESRQLTSGLGDWLSSIPPSRVIVEACTQAFAVARSARAAGHDVRVVPGTLVRSLGVGERGMKNDRRDARALSEASTRVELRSIHVPSQESRDRKAICAMRMALVGARTKLINAARAHLRSELILLASGSAESVTERIRKAMSDREMKISVTLDALLIGIDQLSAQIVVANREIKAIAASDERCQRLMTVPGVGPLVSTTFLATLDDVERFADASLVASYLGLIPGENSTGEKTRKLSITKAGSSRLRFLLIQAAWSARRSRPNDPMVRWSLELEKRRGKRVAVTALARKLGGILYAILRDGTTYLPARGAAPQTGAETDAQAIVSKARSSRRTTERAATAEQ